MGYLYRNIDLSTIPLAVNPDGSPPNFSDGLSLAPVNLSIGAIITAMSAIAVTVRLYASCNFFGRLSLDDCE
jgi:hypothetical protein